MIGRRLSPLVELVGAEGELAEADGGNHEADASVVVDAVEVDADVHEEAVESAGDVEAGVADVSHLQVVAGARGERVALAELGVDRAHRQQQVERLDVAAAQAVAEALVAADDDAAGEGHQFVIFEAVAGVADDGGCVADPPERVGVDAVAREAGLGLRVEIEAPEPRGGGQADAGGYDQLRRLVVEDVGLEGPGKEIDASSAARGAALGLPALAQLEMEGGDLAEVVRSLVEDENVLAVIALPGGEGGGAGLDDMAHAVQVQDAGMDPVIRSDQRRAHAHADAAEHAAGLIVIDELVAVGGKAADGERRHVKAARVQGQGNFLPEVASADEHLGRAGVSPCGNPAEGFVDVGRRAAVNESQVLQRVGAEVVELEQADAVAAGEGQWPEALAEARVGRLGEPLDAGIFLERIGGGGEVVDVVNELQSQQLIGAGTLDVEEEVVRRAVPELLAFPLFEKRRIACLADARLYTPPAGEEVLVLPVNPPADVVLLDRRPPPPEVVGSMVIDDKGRQLAAKGLRSISEEKNVAVIVGGQPGGEAAVAQVAERVGSIQGLWRRGVECLEKPPGRVDAEAEVAA